MDFYINYPLSVRRDFTVIEGSLYRMRDNSLKKLDSAFLKIHGERVSCHKVAWLLHYGFWPDYSVMGESYAAADLFLIFA